MFVPHSIRLALCVALVTGGATYALWGWSLGAAKTRVVTAETQRAQAAGREIAERVDAHYLMTLAAALPEKGAVWAWYGAGSEIEGLQADLKASTERHGFVAVRTLVLDEEAADDVKAASKEAHTRALDQLVTSSAKPAWRHAADYLPEMRAVWKKQRPAHVVTSSRKRGTRVVQWLPLRDRLGDVVALLETTSRIDEPLAAAEKEAKVLTGALGALGVLLTGAVFVLGRAAEAAARPAGHGAGQGAHAKKSGESESEAAAEGHGGDGVDSPADPSELHAEIEGLRTRLAAALAARPTVAPDAPMASPPLDAATLQRRAGFAELADSAALVVDAGNGRREQARLVDLSFDHLVLRVDSHSSVDLAVGMPATVSWAGGEGIPLHLEVRRRVQSEDAIEYEFLVSPGREWMGAPPAVAQLAYVGGKERASAQFTEVTATLMAGRSGPLPAEVVDISATGLGLRVLVTAEELAATGTIATLNVCLTVGGEELVLGVRIRRVRPEGEGCFVGVHIDPALTAEYASLSAQLGRWVEERKRQLELEGAYSAA